MHTYASLLAALQARALLKGGGKKDKKGGKKGGAKEGKGKGKAKK